MRRGWLPSFSRLRDETETPIAGPKAHSCQGNLSKARLKSAPNSKLKGKHPFLPISALSARHDVERKSNNCLAVWAASIYDHLKDSALKYIRSTWKFHKKSQL